MDLEIENNLKTEINNEINNDIKIKQQNFLESDLGKVINTGIDIGLKAILPDFVEDQIIEIKDAIMENGFKEGINQVINSAIDLGKSVSGIFTRNFENISQVQTAVKNGGIIDGVSDLLDVSIKFAKEKGVINSTVASVIKEGKNTILNSVSNKIEDTLTDQLKSVEKLEEHCEKWNEHYKNQDFDKMENSIKNIKKYLDKVVPFENTINNARKIENLHTLIKNNGKKFELSEEEIKLAEKL